MFKIWKGLPIIAILLATANVPICFAQGPQALISRKDLARTFSKELEARFESIPTFGGAGDLSKAEAYGVSLIPCMSWINMRNALVTRKSASMPFLPGTNLLDQIQYLYLLPHDEFLPALRALAGPASRMWRYNPLDALKLARAAVQYSDADAMTDNVVALVHVAAPFWLIFLFRSLIFRDRKVDVAEGEGVESFPIEQGLRVDPSVGSNKRVQTSVIGKSEILRARLKIGLLACAIVLVVCTALSFVRLDYALMDVLFLLKMGTLAVAIILIMAFGVQTGRWSSKMNTDPD